MLAGIEAAAAPDLSPVKINSVLVRDGNLAEAPDLLAWSLRKGYRLRFIEHMPLDADHTWSRDSMVTADEILDAAGPDASPSGRTTRSRTHRPRSSTCSTARTATAWAEPVGSLGIIASVTRPFCRDCDRLRLTADGQLRTCLFAQSETDLRGPLRAGADDDELAELIRTAVAGKQAGHGINSIGFVQPARSMSAIGG